MRESERMRENEREREENNDQLLSVILLVNKSISDFNQEISNKKEN